MENQDFAWQNYQWYKQLNKDEKRTLYIVKHSELINTINLALQKKIPKTERLESLIHDLDSCLLGNTNKVYEILYTRDIFLEDRPYKKGEKILKLNYLMCSKHKRTMKDKPGKLVKIYTRKSSVLYLDFPPIVKNRAKIDDKEYLIPRNRFFEVSSFQSATDNAHRCDLELIMI